MTLAAPLLAAGLGLGIATFGLGVALIRLASLASVPGCDVIGAVEPEPLPAR